MNKKENIQHIALQLFGEKGYDRSSTQEIAKLAGVSEGLLFRHYGSKAGLLKSIIQDGLARIAETMQPYETELSPRDAIILHIEQSLIAVQEQRLFWRLATSMRFQPVVFEIAGREIEMVNQFVLTRLTENFKKLGAAQPMEEAYTLFALIDGICIQWLQNGDSYPIDTMKTHLLKHYLHAKF